MDIVRGSWSIKWSKAYAVKFCDALPILQRWAFDLTKVMVLYKIKFKFVGAR